MRRSSIVIFSCEPGGAEVLIPVIKLLKTQTVHKVIVLGYGYGAERFKRAGIEYEEVGHIAKGEFTILDRHGPNLVISSATSHPDHDMSEKHLWESARTSGIPTLAFLDQWQNYAIRFSGPGSAEPLAYLPDFINAIDAIGERELIAAGIDPQHLIKLGQPYLSALTTDIALVDKDTVRSALKLPLGRRVVLFASEAIAEHYGKSRGYDQYDAIALFMDRMAAKAGRGDLLLIKLHPKDTLFEYQKILANYPNLDTLLIQNEVSALEALAISDEVFGMTSVMLVQAHILGKPVVSLQPGLCVEDPLVLSRCGIIEAVVDKDSVAVKGVKARAAAPVDIDYQFNPGAFLQFVERLLSVQKVGARGD